MSLLYSYVNTNIASLQKLINKSNIQVFYILQIPYGIEFILYVFRMYMFFSAIIISSECPDIARSPNIANLLILTQ